MIKWAVILSLVLHGVVFVLVEQRPSSFSPIEVVIGQPFESKESVEKSASPEKSSLKTQKKASESSESVRIGTDRGSRVSGGLQPIYPTLSRRLSEEGETVLLVTIDSHGNVEGVEILRSSGYKKLDQAALDSVTKVSFEPALQNGKPIASKRKFNVVFRLNQ